MRFPKFPGRLAFCAALVAMFLVMGVSRPEAQSTVIDYSYAYHGPGWSYLTRIWTTGPNVDTYLSSAATGGSIAHLEAHPSMFNPSAIYGVVPGSVGVKRIGAGSGVPVNTYLTTGTVGGACYVNVPPLNPHYFVVGKYASGASLEFFDVQNQNVSEIFVQIPSGPEPIDGAFAKATTGSFSAGNPAYRWFWIDKYPAGSTAETMRYLDLRNSDVQLSGVSQNPWNPTPQIATYGPPFPDLGTQLGGVGPSGISWSGRFFSFGTSGLDDDSHKLQTWTSASGQVFVFHARNIIVSPGPPPTYGDLIDVYAADSPSGTIPVASSTLVTTSGIPTVAHDLKVVGNFLFATAGTNGSYKGGSGIYSYFISPSGALLARGMRPFDGASGCWSNFLKDKVYIGGDDSNTAYGVCAVDPATNGLTTDTGTNPLLPIATHIALSVAEQQLLTPPDRKWVGNDGIGVREDSSAFPGTQFGNPLGKKGKGGACSGALLGEESGAGLGGLAFMFFLVGLAGVTLREAGRKI